MLDPQFRTNGDRDALSLSALETELLQRLADGESIEAIAHTMSFSIFTVGAMISRARTKLDAASNTHGVAIALRLRLIS